MYDILQLNEMILPELRDISEKLKIKGTEKLEKQELILFNPDPVCIHCSGFICLSCNGR